MTNSIQKNSFTQAIANLGLMVDAFAKMGVNMTEKLNEEFNPQSLIDKRKELYEINPQLVANTKKSEIDAAIKEEMANSQAIMDNGMGESLLTPTNTNAPQPTGPNAVPPVSTPATQVPTKPIAPVSTG